ncbi:response regulator [Anabaena sp. UHCC 0451]|uniref:hybrid sensor histidine kinase/response regulator n=1 Tax=Anabaena sp. UHCC 0451 TaxID=2055235 RepID=UPI002B211A62|nr:response regulator [Anabaena sp. UHCC 0451]MEA5577231.1 response regulator [Anabaena sp. UHCC 0451]
MQPEQQQRILGYFIEEARDHLNTIEQGLLKLQDTLNDPEMVNEVFRAAHSIKGGAAMLGLSSIQHTSHRLEDCFKVLKEHPVQVDQKLESLFLSVSDTLKVLLDHLSSPFGLSEETANSLMSESEPIFLGLNQHLELLLQSQGGDTPIVFTQIELPKQEIVPPKEPQKPLVVSQNANWSEYQSQVLQSLREMLQLFKQSSTPSSRDNLQECCQQLVQLGEKFNLPQWGKLCQSATNAIANPDNSYLTLAKIIITEIKQAQELVIQGRESEITISQELESLELIPELELLELTFDWADEQPQTNTEVRNTLEINTDNVLPNSTITFEPIEEFSLAANTNDNDFDSLPEISLNDIDVDLDLEADSVHSLFTDQEETLNHSDNIFDMNGPEVGIAELNTLEDLFKGETDELDETWRQEQILETNSNQLGISNSQVDDSNDDLDDLLLLDHHTSSQELQTPANNTTEDLNLLFGADFLESESSEPQHQTTTPQTPEISDISTSNSHLEFFQSDITEELTVSFTDASPSPEETAPIITTNDEAVDNILGLVSEEDELLSLPEEPEIKSEIIVIENSFDELITNINTDFLEELTIDETASSLTQTQLESLSLDNLLGELEEETTETPDDLEIGDLFALPLNTGAEVSHNEDDLNTFWDQMDLAPEITAEVAQNVAKELEESLFAASGETLADSQQSDINLSFYLGDFDFTENQEKEIEYPSLTTDSEDNLFADLAESPSSSNTVDHDNELSLPEIHSFSQEPEALDFMPEFTNPSAQTDADLDWDWFASFDNNSNEDEPVSLDDLTVIQSINDDQVTADHTLEFSFNNQTQSEALNEDIEHLFNDNFLELNLEEESVTADVSEQIELTLIEEDSQELELETTTAETADSSENTVDEFASLEALLDEELVTETSNSDSLPEVDFAALDALLSIDNAEAEQMAEVPSKLSQPVVRKAQNAAGSSEMPDEFKDLEILLAEADQTMKSPARAAKSNSSKTPRPTIRRVKEESMKIPVKQLDEMSNLVGELVVNRNTLEQDHERLRQSLDNLLIQIQHLSDVGSRMQELYERSLLEASLLSSRTRSIRDQGRSHNSNDRGFSELEMDQFSLFHTLSQETIEYIVRVRESGSDIDFVTEETERVARQFRQVTTQLQEGLTKARMVPFAQAIDRLRRGARDNGIKYGKQVELETEGADTLIDKMILDHLTDPLTHMLNNAIAHGIETPEVRTAAGKPPVGIISIRAFHQGNQTVIAVTDDGAGIDHQKVKLKAIQKGVITPEEAQNMTRQDVYELLFLPSFSTADEIDDIKGRGVGMNVVQNDINEIRGTVSTDSLLGKGTTFTIRLPLTLSICKALFCISDKSRIAFPMDGVEDTIDIAATDIKKDSDGQSFILWRDTALAFRPLKDILAFNRQISRGNIYSNTRDDDMISVVVVRSGNTMVALQVDQVLSEQEIVIKQFEGPAPKPSGVAGATVLGDGRIMPIADVLEIIDIFQGKMSKQIGGSSWQRKTAPPTQTIQDVKIDPTVLIVDDSITVRELLSLTFIKAGYRVEQARDGQEAWDKLRSGLPCDIVFCDIEMPRCDGLKLLSLIQTDSSLNHLPIAMLTSRGADKHRQMAVQLGASGYFTKPYLEEALLEAATRMLRGEKLVTA